MDRFRTSGPACPGLTSRINTFPATLLLLMSLAANAGERSVCAYIASYKPGYVWQDGIENGLRTTLADRCELHRFYMDTKNHKTAAYRSQRGEAARDFIEALQPEVVIVSDDNAVRYVLQPFYKNHRLPFVFCGINDTGRNYQLPYRNTTGMIERKEISDLIYLIKRAAPKHARLAYLGTPTVTARKNLSALQRQLTRGQTLHAETVTSLQEWKARFQALQQDPLTDVIVLGNLVSLNPGQERSLKQWIEKETRKLTATVYEWMMPYAAIGVVNSAYEQGEWAARSALAILDGIPPGRIPVVANQRFQFALNPALWKRLNLDLPDSLSINIATSGWSHE